MKNLVELSGACRVVLFPWLSYPGLLVLSGAWLCYRALAGGGGERGLSAPGKQYFKVYRGINVNDAVVMVPAHFIDSQLRRMRGRSLVEF